MARPDPFDASLTKLRSLFTSAERALLDSSTGKKLAAATESQVKALLKQGRMLRDKWRDLLAAQARAAKGARKPSRFAAVAGSVKANERTRQKSELLATAVARLETRLAAFTGAASPGAAPSARGATKKPAAAVRTTGGPKKKTKAKPAAAGSAISAKARKAGALRSLEAVGVQGLKTSAASQRQASAAFKAERLKFKGITTRRVGHAQARVARAQVRRDQRNASR